MLKPLLTEEIHGMLLDLAASLDERRLAAEAAREERKPPPPTP